MKEIRELVQSKLEEISNIDSGVPIPDDIIESGKTYFGYELQEDYQNSDTDSNYTMQITLIGRLVRKDDHTENTLEIMDLAIAELKSKLKELHFRYSIRDVSLDNGIRKMLVSGVVVYNEINKIISNIVSA